MTECEPGAPCRWFQLFQMLTGTEPNRWGVRLVDTRDIGRYRFHVYECETCKRRMSFREDIPKPPPVSRLRRWLRRLAR